MEQSPRETEEAEAQVINNRDLTEWFDFHFIPSSYIRTLCK